MGSIYCKIICIYFTVKSKSRRWPLQVFFNILDITGIIAWILSKEITGEGISRQEFLFQLVIFLILFLIIFKTIFFTIKLAIIFILY